MVFPLYDDSPFKRARVPYVTWGLIVLNVGIFLFEVGAADDAVKALFASLAATPAAITHQAPAAGWPPAELIDKRKSMWLIDGNWICTLPVSIAMEQCKTKGGTAML